MYKENKITTIGTLITALIWLIYSIIYITQDINYNSSIYTIISMIIVFGGAFISVFIEVIYELKHRNKEELELFY